MTWIQSDFQSGDTSFVPCSWSTGKNSEIIKALQMHYAKVINLHDYWSVGDERPVTLSPISGMSSYNSKPQKDVLVLSHIGGKVLQNGYTECAFQVDLKKFHGLHSFKGSSYINRDYWYQYTYTPQQSVDRCGQYFCYRFIEAFPEAYKSIFKKFIVYTYDYLYDESVGSYQWKYQPATDWFHFRSVGEVFPQSSIRESDRYYTSYESCKNPNKSKLDYSQVDYYKTSANRIKINNIDNYGRSWALRSGNNLFEDSNRLSIVTDSGTISTVISSDATSLPLGFTPFGVI